MKPLRPDLENDGADEDPGKDPGPDQVAQIHGHRDRVAAGLAEGCGGDLDDPEEEGDLGDLALRPFAAAVQVHPPRYCDMANASHPEPFTRLRAGSARDPPDFSLPRNDAQA